MGGGGGGGGGGKKDVNVELNLVPYIDLLSTLICFLLVTAIWQQINALSTSSASSTTSDNPNPPPPDPNRVEFSLSIYQDRVETSAGQEKETVYYVKGEPERESILRILNKWREKWPDRKDVMLHSDSQASYKYLIGVMDILTEAEFTDIGVNTN